MAGADSNNVRNWLTWHFYDDHRDLYERLITVGRTPASPKPDLSQLFPWEN